MEGLTVQPIWIARLVTARRGTAAVLFALLSLPVFLVAGAATDFTRQQSAKAMLQEIADDAALAGASVLNQQNGPGLAAKVAQSYITGALPSVPAKITVQSVSVTTPNEITVDVTIAASMRTSLLALILSALPVSTHAVAKGPGYALQFNKTGGFSSSAADSDSLYFFVIPASGAAPTSAAKMTLLLTNDAKVNQNYQIDNANPKNFAVGANDRIGFALVNVTGGLSSYGRNYYGAQAGTNHIFY